MAQHDDDACPRCVRQGRNTIRQHCIGLLDPQKGGLCLRCVSCYAEGVNALSKARKLTWLLLSLIKAAVSAGLDDTEHQEAAQPGSPHNDQDSCEDLPGIVVLCIGQGANSEGCKGGAAKPIIQLVRLQWC